MGIPLAAARASLGMRNGISVSSRPPIAGVWKPSSPTEHVAEARLACADHPSHRRRRRHDRDHGRDGQVEDDGLALAGAVHAGRRRRPAVRQDAAAGQGAGRRRTGAEVVRLTLEPPPHEATHWTARAMAKAVGLAVATVQKIWKAHGLAPHRWRSFKLSNDPAFAEKLHDVVGLYVAPPAHAVVLRRREVADPGARPYPAGAADEEGPRRDHDPRLQAQRHHDAVRRAERAGGHVTGGTCSSTGIRSSSASSTRSTATSRPARSSTSILDNYAAHKTPEVRRWLARHPRWTFHFTPTSSSWLNAVEGFFAKLTRRRLKHGVFRSVVDLQAAINRFVEEHNQNPKPFVWRADPDDIIAARARGFQTLESIH